ncbi:MAG: nitrate- and nitrite sensing domain-containing protein [Pseudonocardia sediminis]
MTDDDRRSAVLPGWSAPSDWSLRTKLLVVLLVPAVLAVALGGLRIADRVGEADARQAVARSVEVQGGVARYVELLAQERLRAAEFVSAGRPSDDADFPAATAGVDAAGDPTFQAVRDLSTHRSGLVGPLRAAEQAVARLPALRTLVTTSNAPASAAVSRYSDLVDQIVLLDTALLREVNTAEVAGLAGGLAGLSVARNEVSLQQALVSSVVPAAGTLPAATVSELQAGDARLATGLTDFRASLDPAQRVRFAAPVAGGANIARETLVEGVLTGAATPPAGTASRVFGGFLAELDASEDGVRAELTATAAERRDAAVTSATVNGVLLALALLVGLVVVGLIARQMIGSLRALRRGALDVAEVKLPAAVRAMREGSVPAMGVDPVPVDTREEVGEVARAFDAVHAQALRLAAEQATLQTTVNAMFVNLSRRSQTLVDGQLRLIEEMEASEADPELLSRLFRLDHMATRMRRNSENLLVLAGTDLGGRSAKPVRLVDVMRAALSEVEHYRRIVVPSWTEAVVVGHAAVDLQHLLAELLDNATNFSPPDSPVQMSARRIDGGGYLVEIVDRGFGLPARDLDRLNRLLGRRVEASVEASRRMGLFVVGRLAGRHDVDVVLAPGRAVSPVSGRPTGPGLVAQVRIPATLIVEPAPVRTVREVDLVTPASVAVPAAVGGATGEGHRSAHRAVPERADDLFAPVVAPPELPDPLGARPPDPLAAPAEGDTPIFSEVVSLWFDDDREVPVSWERAPDLVVPDAAGRDAAAAEPEIEFTASSLPRRTPGARLVPGSVSGAPVVADRDAAGVRARLAGYQDGVRRGRETVLQEDPPAADRADPPADGPVPEPRRPE